MSPSPTTSSPVRVVALTATLLAQLGAAFMVIAHAGFVLGLPGTPDTGRVILPAVIGFAVAKVTYAAVALGLLCRARWAPRAGVVVFCLTLVAASYPFRGWVSALAIGVSLIALTAMIRMGALGNLPARARRALRRGTTHTLSTS